MAGEIRKHDNCRLWTLKYDFCVNVHASLAKTTQAGQLTIVMLVLSVLEIHPLLSYISSLLFLVKMYNVVVRKLPKVEMEGVIFLSK